VIQTLIQFNGTLSSWWTNIAVGLLTLIFIGAQSLLAARESQRRLISRKLLSRARVAAGAPAAPRPAGLLGAWGSRGSRQRLGVGAGALVVVLVAWLAITGAQNAARGGSVNTPLPTSAACQLQPMRTEAAAGLMRGGAIIVYERNGGPECLDELYGIYPDGRIVGDNGLDQVEKQLTLAEVEELLQAIEGRGWFTEEMYDTWHAPCGQCYEYFISVTYRGQAKAVKAVDGGTDAPANYWLVVTLINKLVPEFPAVAE
jgi:hypothetical protein